MQGVVFRLQISQAPARPICAERVKTDDEVVGVYSQLILWHLFSLYPPHNEVVGGLYWFHPVRPSRIPWPLCSAYSSDWIYLIFIHLITQDVSGVSREKVFAKFQNLYFWQFFNVDFVFFWLGIWCESLVWGIMGRRGVSQNAGVLVVLVLSALWCK